MSDNSTNDVRVLSRYFSALIRAALSAEELAEVIRRNRNNPDQGCATHDFRDANCYMFGAYATLIFGEPDLSDEQVLANMGAAWDLSKATEFAL